MLQNIFGKVYDNQRPDSISANLRNKRMALFSSLTSCLPTHLRILDIGGRPNFWENTNFISEHDKNIDLTIVNVEQIQHPNFKCIVGDARNLNNFENKQFDIVFSNSVIEHVGDYEDQLKMANEIIRLGKAYFIQTPNLYFPIEPHFVFPFFQFLPISLRIYLLMHFDLGWRKKTTDREKAKSSVTSIKLLSKNALSNLFPQGEIYEEKFLGMTKSFVVYSKLQ